MMEVERHAVVSSVVVLLCDTSKGMYHEEEKEIILGRIKNSKKENASSMLANCKRKPCKADGEKANARKATNKLVLRISQNRK